MIKNPPDNAGDSSSIPGWGRSLEKETATYSCLGNSTDREAWHATVHGAAESDTNSRLNNNNMGRPLHFVSNSIAIVVQLTLKDTVAGLSLFLFSCIFPGSSSFQYPLM